MQLFLNLARPIYARDLMLTDNFPHKLISSQQIINRATGDSRNTKTSSRSTQIEMKDM